jgi:flagellar biosynthetic protein FliQ
MNADVVIDIGQQAMEVTGVLTGMVLLPALAIGLVVAMFQAVTQINEMTLTFIPKLLVVALVLVMAGPWMLQYFLNYATGLINSIPELVHWQ